MQVAETKSVKLHVLTCIYFYLTCKEIYTSKFYTCLATPYLLIKGDLLADFETKYLMNGSLKYPLSHIDSLLTILLSLVL